MRENQLFGGPFPPIDVPALRDRRHRRGGHLLRVRHDQRLPVRRRGRSARSPNRSPQPKTTRRRANRSTGPFSPAASSTRRHLRLRPPRHDERVSHKHGQDRRESADAGVLDDLRAPGGRPDLAHLRGEAEAVPAHRPSRMHPLRRLRRHLPLEMHPHALHRRHRRSRQRRPTRRRPQRPRRSSSSTKTSAPAAPCASTAAPPASSSWARSPTTGRDGDPNTRTNRHGYAYGVRF